MDETKFDFNGFKYMNFVAKKKKNNNNPTNFCNTRRQTTITPNDVHSILPVRNRARDTSDTRGGAGKNELADDEN